MRFLILGGTGPTGIHLIRETLKVYEGSTAVVYARAPEKLPEDLTSHPSIVIIKGVLEDLEAFEKAVEGVDVVLSALGPTSGPKAGPTPVATAYQRFIPLMKKHGVKRLIALNTASHIDPNDKPSWKYSIMVWAVRILVPGSYAELLGVDQAIVEGAGDGTLEWTIVRVPGLTNLENDEVRAGYVGDEGIGLQVSRRAFAVFVAGEVGKREWVNKRPVISSP